MGRGRSCSICTSEDLAAINRALMDGETLQVITGKYGKSKSALNRHKKSHLPALLALSEDPTVLAAADDLADHVRSLRIRALGILDKAENAGKLSVALSGIREVRGVLQLQAQLERPVPTSQTNVQINLGDDGEPEEKYDPALLALPELDVRTRIDEKATGQIPADVDLLEIRCRCGKPWAPQADCRGCGETVRLYCPGCGTGVSPTWGLLPTPK